MCNQSISDSVSHLCPVLMRRAVSHLARQPTTTPTAIGQLAAPWLCIRWVFLLKSDPTAHGGSAHLVTRRRTTEGERDAEKVKHSTPESTRMNAAPNMNFLNLLDRAEARDNARLSARPQGIMRKRSSSLLRMSRAAAKSIGDGLSRNSRSGRRPPIPQARGLAVGGPALDTARRAPRTPRTPRT